MYEQPSSKYGLVIRVDQDVRNRIEELRKPGESINDVLRRVFNLNLRCAGCYTNQGVEEIPDILNHDVPLCVNCFGHVVSKGRDNTTPADFPFLKE